MEHAEALPEPPCVLDKTPEEEGAGARQLLSPEAMGCFFPETPKEKMEADHRSIYVGNVDYGGSAAELEAYFSPCGEIHRVTILCDKFSGHPKGYAYIEFASQSSAQAAVELDESIFRGRVIKVLPKRTNFPGISSTDRGGLRKNLCSRAQPFLHSSLHHRHRFRSRGQSRVLCLQKGNSAAGARRENRQLMAPQITCRKSQSCHLSPRVDTLPHDRKAGGVALQDQPRGENCHLQICRPAEGD